MKDKNKEDFNTKVVNGLATMSAAFVGTQGPHVRLDQGHRQRAAHES